jgi:membrane protein implicated in regulation of membrane protease activity
MELQIVKAAPAGVYFAFAPVVFWLRLRGVLFLYLVALIAFLVYRLVRKREGKN